jgi:hypothetical protein
MSQEHVRHVQRVRTPLAVSSKTRPRSLVERILVRFPILSRVLALTWSRLPPRSRMRRGLTVHNLRRAYEA